MTANERLRDLILRRTVVRGQIERELRRQLVEIWRTIGRDVNASVLSIPDPLSSERAYDALARLSEIVQQGAERLVTRGTDALGAFASREIAELPLVLERGAQDILPEGLVVPFQMAFVSDAAALLSSPLGGGTISTVMADVQTDVLRGTRNALAVGVARKQSVKTAAPVIRTVIGNKRWAIERTIQSEYARIANQAALLTYQRNHHAVRAVQWSATLSGQTCLVCASLHSRVWTDWVKVKIPVIASHTTCRCMLLPVVKTAEDLGLSSDLRVVLDGRPAATLTYADWFAHQDETFQLEVLGPTRHALYRQGKATLSDFVRRDKVRRVGDVRARIQRRISAR